MIINTIYIKLIIKNKLTNIFQEQLHYMLIITINNFKKKKTVFAL